MNTNAPEKIWINPATDLAKLNGYIDKDSVKYTRTDAFIEKVINFLNYKLDNIVATRVPGTIIPHLVTKQELIEDFKKYIYEIKNSSKNL